MPITADRQGEVYMIEETTKVSSVIKTLSVRGLCKFEFNTTLMQMFRQYTIKGPNGYHLFFLHLLFNE